MNNTNDTTADTSGEASGKDHGTFVKTVNEGTAEQMAEFVIYY